MILFATDREMEFVFTLGRQPLFKLLGAFIVLLLTDLNLYYGAAAGLVWVIWIVVSRRISSRGSSENLNI